MASGNLGAVQSCIAMQVMVPGRSGVRPRQPIDWVEGILPAPGILVILLGVSLSRERGWQDPLILGSIVLGAGLLALWARRSLRSREPFIDLRLLANREVALANIISILMALGTLNLVLVLTTYMQAPTWTLAGLGLAATAAGLVKLPANALALLAGPLSGWLVQTRGNRIPVMLGGALAAAGWLFAMSMPTTVGQLLALMIVITFGTAVLNATLPIVIIGGVPPERTSESVGTMTVARGMFGAVGAQFISLLLASHTVSAPGMKGAFPSPEGFALAMAWMGALSLCVAVIGYFLADGRPSKAAAPAVALGRVGPADI